MRRRQRDEPIGELMAMLRYIPVYPSEIESSELARKCGVLAKYVHQAVISLSADMPLAERDVPFGTGRICLTYFCWPDAAARRRGFRMARKIQEKRNNGKLHD